MMFKNKVLLITGGTGSFGNAVLRNFLSTDIKEIRIFSLSRCGPVVFDSIQNAAIFLSDEGPNFPSSGEISQYEYQVSFSDGTEFSRTLNTLEEVRKVNSQLLLLVEHINNLTI